MTRESNIGDLWVAHRARRHGEWTPGGTLPAEFESRGFVLDTCLRRLCFGSGPVPPLRQRRPAQVEWFTGADAYRFMLEVTTGLRSDVPGETNVSGQVRKAWAAFREKADSGAVAVLSPWMHRLFNDTGAIRRTCLQGIGGSSYGTLVRRLIAGSRYDRVLVVGSGDLARSIVPYLGKFRVGIWNHHDVHAGDWDADTCFPATRSADAARWAQHVVFTTPPDPHNDTHWQNLLMRSQPASLVHLGHRRGELRNWPVAARRYDLDDVFDLQRQQDDARSHRISLALRACADAARAADVRGGGLQSSGDLAAA